MCVVYLLWLLLGLMLVLVLGSLVRRVHLLLLMLLEGHRGSELGLGLRHLGSGGALQQAGGEDAMMDVGW